MTDPEIHHSAHDPAVREDHCSCLKDPGVYGGTSGTHMRPHPRWPGSRAADLFVGWCPAYRAKAQREEWVREGRALEGGDPSRAQLLELMGSGAKDARVAWQAPTHWPKDQGGFTILATWCGDPPLVFLAGDNRSGKTQLAQELLLRGFRSTGAPLTGVVATARWIRGSEVAGIFYDKEDNGHRRRELLRVPWLVVDDLSVNIQKGAWAATEDLVCGRFAEGRPTILTCRDRITAIAENQIPSLIARLKEGVICDLGDKGWRGRR